MNAKKQKELKIEHGQLQIRVRALEDRLAVSERQTAEQKGYLAIVCFAFKNYIRSTTLTAFTDEQISEKLDRLVKEAVEEVGRNLKTKGAQSDDH